MNNLIETLKSDAEAVQKATLPPLFEPLVRLIVDQSTALLAQETRIANIEAELKQAREVIESAAVVPAVPTQPQPAAASPATQAQAKA